MAVNEPIDPVVRLAIAQWPDDAPRAAVSTFCAEHGISYKSFYAVGKRAKADVQTNRNCDSSHPTKISGITARTTRTPTIERTKIQSPLVALDSGCA